MNANTFRPIRHTNDQSNQDPPRRATQTAETTEPDRREPQTSLRTLRGLRAYPRRAAEARDQCLGHHDRHRVAKLGAGTGAATDRPQLVGVPARPSAQHARRQTELRGRRRPRGRCVRVQRVAPGWVGPPGGGWRPPLHGGCRRATFSLSSGVEPFGAPEAERSPRDPRAVTAAAVASIACSRRTPKRAGLRRPTAKCSGATSKRSALGPRSPPTAHRIH